MLIATAGQEENILRQSPVGAPARTVTPMFASEQCRYGGARQRPYK